MIYLWTYYYRAVEAGLSRNNISWWSGFIPTLFYPPNNVYQDISVEEEGIKNKTVRENFYNIQDIWSIIGAPQLKYPTYWLSFLKRRGRVNRINGGLYDTLLLFLLLGTPSICMVKLIVARPKIRYPAPKLLISQLLLIFTASNNKTFLHTHYLGWVWIAWNGNCIHFTAAAAQTLDFHLLIRC